jgi:hypothetical protein
MAKFEPDEPITKIKVQVHTVALSDASTDSDIFVELFDWPEGLDLPGVLGPFAAEIDTSDYNDFEGGDTKWYTLPSWYYGGRIVNDIVRVCVHKGDDWGTDWGLGWISVWVNGKELFTSPNMASKPDKPTWLSDGEKWCGGYKRVEFVGPVIETLGLPDAGSNENYSVLFTATGGRKPLKWTLKSPKGSAFTATPTLTNKNAEGTECTFAAHTVTTSTAVDWSGTLQVVDAEGRSSTKPVSMRVIFSLPAPTIKSFAPAIGWPGLTPAEPTPVVVTVNSKKKDFDSRKPGATKVFLATKGSSVEAKVLDDITSSQLRFRVPAGAAPGAITVQTAFGKTSSSDTFMPHPNGYRFVSGFSFRNRVKDDDPSDGFPNTFAWERFEQTFGLDEMWLTVFDQAIVPNPIATFFFLTTHDSIGNGCCHGFSLMSLQMKNGIIPTSAFQQDDNEYPLDDALWNFTGPDKPSSGLSKWIQTRQLVVFSDEGLSFYLTQIDDIPNVSGQLCQMDARTALNDFKAALNNGLANPRMLAFAKNCAPWDGHVVVPYNVEKDGSTENIRLYDSNRPAATDDVSDKDSRLWVKTGNGEWGYTWKDGALWNGVYMFTIPLTEYGHQTDWSLPGLSTLGATVGTLILGCAGTDSGSEIVQVTDGAGRPLFDNHGATVQDRSLWPAGARPIPKHGNGGKTRHLIAITKPEPLDFTVRLRGVMAPGSNPSGLFSATLGADVSIAVEDFSAALRVKLDAGGTAVDVDPLQGKTSPIVRISKRSPQTMQSLSLAVRLRDVAAGKPVRVGASPDGSVMVRVGDDPVTMDLEVTHTSRIGEVRILESDDISAPARSVATFHVPNPTELDLPGAKPIVFELDPDGTGTASTHSTLGQRLTGLTVVAPARVIARPTIHIGKPPPNAPESKVAIDVSRSTTAFANQPMRFRVLDGPPATAKSGKLVVPLSRGTRPLRVIAEDASGRRSFPRTVFVTVPEENQKVVWPMTAFFDEVSIQPGATGELKFGVYVIDQPAVGVVLDLSIRERRSGIGTAMPKFVTNAVVIAPDVKSIGGKVKATAGAGGLTLHVEISWDQSKPRTGRIDLGHIRVQIPADLTLGSTFILRGSGAATIAAGGKTSQQPLNVLPAAVKIWGGAEPQSLAIEGPAEVKESAEIVVHATGQGISPGQTNIGWWAEQISGIASVRPANPADPTAATVKAQRAGLVRLKVVVGTHVAEKVVRVKATVRPNLVGSGSRMKARRWIKLLHL